MKRSTLFLTLALTIPLMISLASLLLVPKDGAPAIQNENGIPFGTPEKPAGTN